MIDIKAKTRIHRYSCYYCDCTGFFERKRTVFQIWSWGYQIVDKKICNYCNGRGFIESKHRYNRENNFQSFLEH